MSEIIFVNIGVFQPYILDSIQQAKLFGHSITVLTDPELTGFFSDLEGVQLITTYNLDIDDFIAKNKLNTVDRDGFETHCSKRLFYLYAYMKQYNRKQCFHIENDIMLYSALDSVPYERDHVWMTMDSINRCIPGIVYIPAAASLEDLVQNYDYTRNDMVNMAAYFHRNQDICRPFPIIAQNKQYPDFNIYSGYAKVYKGLFDAAAIGQYLGGVDPRNKDGDSRGFVNETCVVDYSKYTFSWIKNTNGLYIPHIRIEDIDYPIFNLHIHCKRLSEFMSTGPKETKYCRLVDSTPTVCAVFVCNKLYFNKFINTCSQLITVGKYEGPICLVIGDDLLNDEVLQCNFIIINNIQIKHFPDIVFPDDFLRVNTTLQTDGRNLTKKFQWHKLHLFHTYFKQWDSIFYVDCGMSIYADVSPILNERKESVLLAHSDAYPFYEWKLSGQFDSTKEDYYTKLSSTYNLTIDYFQTTMLLYSTNILEENTLNNLYNLALQYPISRTNEQGIVALYFTSIKPYFQQLKIKNDTTYFYDFLSRNPDNTYIMTKLHHDNPIVDVVSSRKSFLVFESEVFNTFFKKQSYKTDHETLCNLNGELIPGHICSPGEGFYTHINYYSMKRALELLLERNPEKKRFTFIETGCAAHGTKSTLLWDKFVNFYDGTVQSVDLNPHAVKETQALASSKTTVVCSDSLQFLPSLTEPIDFLYLDCYDANYTDLNQGMLFALHHHKEFNCVKHLLHKNSIILIDDTPISPDWLDNGTYNSSYDQIKQLYDTHGSIMGKGNYVNQELATIGAEKILHQYQTLWVF